MENDKQTKQSAENLPTHPERAAEESRETVPNGNLEALLDHVERDVILAALRAARGNKAKAARALDITERKIGIRLQKYHIDWKEFRKGGAGR